ncbi:MAG TPA: alpha/beta hydrolase [Pseudomonas sp.]|uniref:alpha/beta fold hydrolase n=1 Tax=Pseudomonas sp. TaxID=306 RepID=UPI002CB2C4D0|nr:alpha/beta hydrolase [Pseudomonas sp.]HSX88094.1 alpha/beta hydrolase [Pseudomonas sp.]
MNACNNPQVSGFLAAPHQFIDIEGLRFGYRDYGTGPVLLMLHGWPLNGDTFAPLVDALASRFRCIVPDLPGAGVTAWSTEHDLSPAGQARLLQGLFAALGIAQGYSVLGNDSGGIAARYLALLDAGRVAKLVLLNSEIPGHRAPNQRLYKQLARWLPGYGALARIQLRSAAYLCSKLGFGGTLYDHQHLLGSFHQRFIAPLIESAQNMEQARRSFIAVLDWPQLDALSQLHGQIAAQTLLIWGRQDDTFPESYAIEMSRSFAKLAGFISIDKAKLYVHEDQPEQVIQHLEAFLLAKQE